MRIPRDSILLNQIFPPKKKDNIIKTPMAKTSKKRKVDVTPQSFSYDSVVNKMPPPRDCYFHWVTMQSVRIRTLFEAVQNVIQDAVLLIRPATATKPASISLDRYDNSRCMVVYVNLNKMDPSTFYVEKEIQIGLNLNEFYKTLKAVIQNDVVGMCIHKGKWDGVDPGSEMSLDVYIMNENDMYCYEYQYKALAIEYVPVGLPNNTTFRHQISINCANFKRYLNDCAIQGDFLKFTSTYSAKHKMIETVLTPVRGVMRLAKLSLSLFSPVVEGFDPEQFGKSKVEHEFNIGSLQLFTKATTLCQNVRLLLDDNFPAVIEYDVGSLGKLRFLLAWRVDPDELEGVSNAPMIEHLPSEKMIAELSLEKELVEAEKDLGEEMDGDDPMVTTPTAASDG